MNQQQLATDTEFEINLFKFAELNKAPIAEAYSLAVQCTNKWLTSIYKVTTPDNCTTMTPLLAKLIHDEKEKRIFITWNPSFVSLISGDMVPGTFIKSDIRMSLSRSKTRYNLYEELQKHIYILFAKNRASFDISLEELRFASGVTTQYPEYKDFNKYVLKPTLEDIEKLIHISLQAEKRRSWNFIRFTLTDKVFVSLGSERMTE
jgi:hypothetical protein